MKIVLASRTVEIPDGGMCVCVCVCVSAMMMKEKGFNVY